MGRKEPLSARTQRSFNREVGQGRGSFNSTTARPQSAPRSSARGGPGEHDYTHLYSCGRTGQQTTSSFRSASPLAGHIRRSTTPGVGAYNPSSPQSQPEILAHQSVKSFSKDGSSMFAGPGPRARAMGAASGTTAAVGPGSYEADHTSMSRSAHDKLNPRLPAFNSSAPRHDEELWYD